MIKCFTILCQNYGNDSDNLIRCITGVLISVLSIFKKKIVFIIICLTLYSLIHKSPGYPNICNLCFDKTVVASAVAQVAVLPAVTSEKVIINFRQP